MSRPPCSAAASPGARSKGSDALRPSRRHAPELFYAGLVNTSSGTAVTDDGAELYWEAHGTGRPLLLIAGQATSLRGWLHVVPQLAERHRVVLFDHRGIGRSTEGGDEGADESRFATRAFAGDAVAVLDALEIERADVYGHSMGGRVAQWLAVDHAERLNRLVLAATTGGDALDPPRARAVNTILARGDAATMAPYFFSSKFSERYPGVVHDFFARDASVSVRRGHYQASRAHHAWDDLHRIKAPTLVIHGADDVVTPPVSAESIAERIPGAELFIEPGQVHCLHLESDEVRRRVADFLG